MTFKLLNLEIVDLYFVHRFIVFDFVVNNSLLIEGAFMLYPYSRGQGLIEYALLILLIGLVVLVLLAVFGADTGNMFSNVITNL